MSWLREFLWLGDGMDLICRQVIISSVCKCLHIISVSAAFLAQRQSPHFGCSKSQIENDQTGVWSLYLSGVSIISDFRCGDGIIA
jgi:hypothetical protein